MLVAIFIIQNISYIYIFIIQNNFIRVYDGTKYLELFGPEKYNTIYKRIRYLVSQKSGITYALSHNYPRIKIDVIILIESVFNKNQNHYYYKIFLETCSYQLVEKWWW